MAEVRHRAMQNLVFKVSPFVPSDLAVASALSFAHFGTFGVLGGRVGWHRWQFPYEHPCTRGASSTTASVSKLADILSKFELLCLHLEFLVVPTQWTTSACGAAPADSTLCVCSGGALIEGSKADCILYWSTPSLLCASACQGDGAHTTGIPSVTLAFR